MTHEQQIRAEAETLRDDRNFGPTVADDYLRAAGLVVVSEDTGPSVIETVHPDGTLELALLGLDPVTLPLGVSEFKIRDSESTAAVTLLQEPHASAEVDRKMSNEDEADIATQSGRICRGNDCD